jgi:hypothetical protein
MKAVFQALNLFKSFLQPGSRLPLFGEIHGDPEKANEVARIIQLRVRYVVNVFDRPVWKNDPIIPLEVGLGLLSSLIVSCLDWRVLRMNSANKCLAARRILLIWVDAKNFASSGESVGDLRDQRGF